MLSFPFDVLLLEIQHSEMAMIEIGRILKRWIGLCCKKLGSVDITCFCESSQWFDIPTENVEDFREIIHTFNQIDVEQQADNQVLLRNINAHSIVIQIINHANDIPANGEVRRLSCLATAMLTLSQKQRLMQTVYSFLRSFCFRYLLVPPQSRSRRPAETAATSEF